MGVDILKKKHKQMVLAFIIIIVSLGVEKLTGVDLLGTTGNKNNDNQIELIRCIDGDTAEFTDIGVTRFLYIDTPESTKTVEPYGKEAAEFTCNALKNADEILFEYDGSKKDRYDRTLAWIFVDGKLLQAEIANQGYVEKYYQYKTKYKYEDLVKSNLDDKYNIFEGE